MDSSGVQTSHRRSDLIGPEIGADLIGTPPFGEVNSPLPRHVPLPKIGTVSVWRCC
jgi:hypothetical protein